MKNVLIDMLKTKDDYKGKLIKLYNKGMLVIPSLF